MLDSLYVRNFAIVDEAKVQFRAGFNVLSGETGAGKSILIDALGLQMGARADVSWIRHGEERSEIQSFFNLSKQSEVFSWLKENEFNDELTCQLRRTMNQNGKSRCYINGIPTTVSNTQTIASYLIDIHGQHAHQSLLHQDKQLTILDDFCQHDDLLEAVKAAYHKLKSLYKLRSEYQADDTDLDDKRALLEYQLNELSDLDIKSDEFDALSKEQKKFSNEQLIQQKLDLLDAILNDDNGVYSSLLKAEREALNILAMDDDAKELSTLISDAVIYIAEAQTALSKLTNRLDIDPERFDWIEKRMSQLYQTARKHRCQPDDLSSVLLNLQDSLDAMKAQEAQFANLETDIENAEKAYYKAAKQLLESRESKAKTLISAVNDKLALLGMKDASFNISFTPIDKPSLTGNERVLFLFAPNLGQGEKPLHKIASGGELSRISLAIQVAAVLHKTDATLIFDEVDSGIGGATAEIVGQMLQSLSRYNQVICVTHLPQVAVYADHHIFIKKSVVEAQTVTNFTVLSGDERLNEIARMVGGLDMNEETLAYANKMLQQADNFKSTIQSK